MNDAILEKLKEKIAESDSHIDEIKNLANSITECDSNSVVTGVIVGRLYNAFYYQTRRVLHRDPTSGEFAEFLKFVKFSGIAKKYT